MKMFFANKPKFGNYDSFMKMLLFGRLHRDIHTSCYVLVNWLIVRDINISVQEIRMIGLLDTK